MFIFESLSYCIKSVVRFSSLRSLIDNRSKAAKIEKVLRIGITYINRKIKRYSLNSRKSNGKTYSVHGGGSYCMNKHLQGKDAELKTVCIETGMFALREQRVHVTQEEFEMAAAKVMKKETEKNMSLRFRGSI